MIPAFRVGGLCRLKEWDRTNSLQPIHLESGSPVRANEPRVLLPEDHIFLVIKDQVNWRDDLCVVFLYEDKLFALIKAELIPVANEQ